MGIPALVTWLNFDLEFHNKIFNSLKIQDGGEWGRRRNQSFPNKNIF